MASILDQYEQAETGSGVPRTRKAQEPIVAGGFVNASIDEEYPIFNKQKISFTPKDPIDHMAVSNAFLVLALRSNILIRIDLEHSENRSEIELPKSIEDKIVKLNMDPTGCHLVISMASSENYYLSKTAKKVKNLSKLKGHQISSVAWNRLQSTPSQTGKILIGTTKGMIFETEIIDNEDGKFFQSSVDQYAAPMFKLAKEKPYPVTGLRFERMLSKIPNECKYFIMATLPGRLHQFIGKIPVSAEAPIFSHIFNEYQNVPDRFLELPGNFGYSDLQFFYPRGLEGSPSHFAWMTGPGIYYGEIDVTGASGPTSVYTNAKLINYPREDGERPRNPISIVLTEFHVMIAFPDRVKAICLLNDQLIHEELISEKFGQQVSICKDSAAKGSIWSHTSKVVFKYRVVREARDVWRMYLDRGDFEKAKLYSKDNPAHVNTVLTKEAESLYSQQKYVESAKIYAMTQNSFEEITLKLVNLSEKDALQAFLLQKMESLTPQDKTQQMMIVTWLTEIYLNQLGSLRERGAEAQKQYNDLQEVFHKFLAKPRVKECVQANKDTIYELITSHGDVENMVFFAVFIQDIERVVTHHIQHENPASALEVLSKQRNSELFYKFSPVLMQSLPRETVDAWITQGKGLKPKKLIPALVQCNHKLSIKQSKEAIRYLEFCVQQLQVRDQAIHNYLLSLYVQTKDENLMKYLNLQGQTPSDVCYDLKYALRLCAEHDHKRACVHIYCTMELYEEAVDLALQVDVDLAKDCADVQDIDAELQRKLWLRIARHVVEEEKDIKRAMEFIHECDMLKIEDILPFFPDFVTIDHFKDSICQSLQEYNEHIEGLKREMEEATDSARDIRVEIHSFRNKYSLVRAQDRCCSCNFPLMTRGFYVFPCQHSFHKDCLVNEVMPNLNSINRQKVDSLMATMAQTKDMSLKEKIDDIIAAECLYCGDLMISCIDKPFIEEDEYEDVMNSWL